MKRSFLFVFVAWFTTFAAWGDDAIQWGAPVKGLRIGIQTAATNVTSDQALKFTITAQNLSSASIVLPTLDTFLLVSGRDDGFRQTPLMPELVRLGSSFGVRTMATSSPRGPDVSTLQEHTMNLAPNQTVTWNDVPLGRSFFAPGPMIEPFHKAMVETEVLQPGSRCRVSYRFENDQAEVANTTAWTGQVDTGTIELTVGSPSTAGIKVDGGFTLPKRVYEFGEQITATFAVTNESAEEIHFPTGGDYRLTGRHDRFSIHAFDGIGIPVSDPSWWRQMMGGMGGGLGSEWRLKPGETYHEDVIVGQWCKFPGPGHYTIHFQRTLNVTLGGSSHDAIYGKPADMLPAVPVESTIDITIIEPIWFRLFHLSLGLALIGLGTWHIWLKQEAVRVPGRVQPPVFNTIFAGPVLWGFGMHYFAAGSGLPIPGWLTGVATLIVTMILLSQARRAARLRAHL